MQRLITFGNVVLLSGVLLFCWFGYWATFEPNTQPDRSLAFRFLYAVIGVGSLAAIVRASVGRRR
jgi:hypothetical protein